MSNILRPLISRLRDAGSARWELIATAAGVAKTLPRKLVYGERANPKLLTIEPLLDYFEAVDRGERALPEPTTTSVEAGWDAVCLEPEAAALPGQSPRAAVSEAVR